MKSFCYLLFPMICLATVSRGFSKEREMLNNYRAVASKWEEQMAEFDARNATEKRGKDVVLFIGSSSIRLWETIEEDLAPVPVIQRGFGGAKISDVAVYADRLISPHDCGSVVFFIGGNDVWGNPDDKSPEEIRWFADYLIKKVRDAHGDIPVFFIEITPSPARIDLTPLVNDLNAALEAACKNNAGVTFIPTRSHFLKDDVPDESLFAEDQLHLNRKGYELWTKIITPFISPPAPEAEAGAEKVK